MPEALHGGGDPPEQLDGPLAGVLPDGQLEEEEGQAGDEEHDQVGKEESHTWNFRGLKNLSFHVADLI